MTLFLRRLLLGLDFIIIQFGLRLIQYFFHHILDKLIRNVECIKTHHQLYFWE